MITHTHLRHFLMPPTCHQSPVPNSRPLPSVGSGLRSMQAPNFGICPIDFGISPPLPFFCRSACRAPPVWSSTHALHPSWQVRADSGYLDLACCSC